MAPHGGNQYSIMQGLGKLGRLELLEEIGQGANSVVYRAQQPGDPPLVAVKVMKKSLSYAESYLGRFGSEVKVAASLVHPGICRVYSSGKEEDRAYVVMELVQGRLLSDVIAREGRLSPRETVDIAIQMAEALEYAHRQDIVHRDIKPDNIMLGSDGRVKILDFGIARRGASSAQDKQVVGTPAYMSPEQARGESVDDRTDVYSLGAVMYHALVGRPPFEGSDVQEVLDRVAHRAPPPPEGAPARLRAVVGRAMAPLAKRYMSAARMLEELRALRDGMPVTASAPSGGGGRLAMLAIAGAVLALIAAVALVIKAGVFSP